MTRAPAATAMEPPVGDAGALALERVPCNLCGADDTSLLYRKPDTRFWRCDDVFDVVRCRRCRLGYVNPRPTRAAIGRFYPPEFFDRRGVEHEQRRYEAEARVVETHGRGRLLDVGCAGGAFVRVMRERGWDAAGMDRFDAGNAYDVPIRHGELPELGYPEGSFDVVTAWGVFEHLHDPMSYYREAARVLAPGGRLVCLVTNLRSVWSRLSYAEDVPRHLYFFSPGTLDAYARASGLVLAGVDHSNRVLRPDSTDVFRVHLLRWLGFGWREIHASPPPARRRAVRPLERGARLLGRALFGGRLESQLRISGVVVATMQKPARGRPDAA